MGGEVFNLHMMGYEGNLKGANPPPAQYKPSPMSFPMFMSIGFSTPYPSAYTLV